MTVQPLVSVLMPVYNAEKTLCRAMDSILAQTYKNIVVVVVLEYNCTDGTVALLHDYAIKDNRISIYQNSENLGVARSLNRGLDLCVGKYIARMDADDYSYPKRIEKQVAFMEDNPEITILGCFRRIIYDTHSIVEERPISDKEIKVHLLFNIFAAHPTIMLRAEPFKENTDWRYPITPTEDYDLFAFLCTKTTFAIIPEPLVDYYKSNEQATSLSAEAIRASNLHTSKETIKREFGINTDDMPDGYFGMRGVDPLAYDIADHLLGAAKLFCDMEAANEQLGKFDRVALATILEKEWLHIKTLYHLKALGLSFREAVSSDLGVAIESIINAKHFTGDIVVYGMGSFTQGFFPTANIESLGLNVIAYCDSNPSKHGVIFLGKPVIPPCKLRETVFDYVAISAPIYENEIREELISTWNIPDEKICSITTIGDELFFIKRKAAKDLYSYRGTEKRAFMFCSADYRNLGDHAIAYSEVEFFKERVKTEVVEVGVNQYKELSEIAKRYIRKDDLILITGGGFLGSLWPNTEQMARKVVRAYSGNPIVILPQTLYWDENIWAQKEAKKTREVYEACENLTICARDNESYRLFNEYYPSCRVILVPDMVLSCEWGGFFDAQLIRGGTLVCLKNDKESILCEDDKKLLFDIGERLCDEAYVTDTVLGLFFSLSLRIQKLKEKLNEFASAKLCITDRLHGVIFSAITSTPCVALGTCNHKLRESTNVLEYLPYIKFAESVADVEALAIEAMAVNNPHFSNTELRNYYAQLEHMLCDKMRIL